ncbi:MAG: TIGR02996 domain-containing protein [Myxococcales bacterium]
MPEPVRAVFADARTGRGPLAAWQTERQLDLAYDLLQGQPVRLPDEVVGWAVGMALFGDPKQTLEAVLSVEELDGPIPAIVDAFAAGLQAGVKPQARQWASIESLSARLAQPSPAVLQAVVLGLASGQTSSRVSAMQIALRWPARAREAIAAARASAASKVARRLDDALASLQSPTRLHEGESDDARAQRALLAQLVDAWGQTRDARLTEVIRALGQDAARRRGPLQAPGKAELEGLWHATAAGKDPGDVDRLLGTPWPGPWRAAMARVEALAQFPPDPRLSSGALAAVSQYPSSASDPLHEAIAALVRQVADPGCIDAIDRAKAYCRDLVFSSARAACLSAKSTPAADELLVAARSALPGTPPLEDLWRAVFQAPSEIERRLVLADALQAVGDPRGEFIALQCALADGRGGAQVQRRVAELLAAHGDAWTGLPGVERASRRFERGFLVAASCSLKAHELASALERREWATLEELRLDTKTAEASALVRRMPCLRVLSTNEDETLKRLGYGAPLPGVRALSGEFFVPAEGCAAFPALEILGGEWWGVRYQFDEAECRSVFARVGPLRLRALTVFRHRIELIAPALAVWAASPGPEELRISTGPQWGFSGAQGWRLRVRREGARAEVAWGGGPAARQAELGACVEQLVAAGYREVAVFGAREKADLGAVRERCASLGVQVVEGEPAAKAAPDTTERMVREPGASPLQWPSCR